MYPNFILSDLLASIDQPYKQQNDRQFGVYLSKSGLIFHRGVCAKLGGAALAEPSELKCRGPFPLSICCLEKKQNDSISKGLELSAHNNSKVSKFFTGNKPRAPE